MKEEPTITFLFNEDAEEDIQTFVPEFKQYKTKLIKIRKKIISKSLTKLINDVNEVLEDIPKLKKTASLDEIQINCTVTAEGGLTWIGSATLGCSNSMTLTFKIRQ